MTNNSVKALTKFELYLEGVKIPFSSVSIQESEETAPQAAVVIPATSGAYKVLPGTIVQFFGPDPQRGHQILLFEGEIVAFAFNKMQEGRSVTFQARSLLSKWETTRARPSDAATTNRYANAMGQFDYRIVDMEEKMDTPESNIRYSAQVKAGRERITDEVSGFLSKAINDIKLTETGGFSAEFTKLMSSEEIKNGDLHEFTQFFMRIFELYDPYYGIEANSYKIATSVLT